MKESQSSTIPISQHQQEQQTPDYRLVPNPFDPPSSVHLKQRLASFSIFNDQPETHSSTDILSIERRAQINPQRLGEHIVQIDTSLFNEELRDRYQRASDHFCQTHLDLPTPILPVQQGNKSKNTSWSSDSSTSSLDQTRTTRHMACQTRLSLPPAADLDSLIQSFASNSDPDDPPQLLANNSSLNNSQIRRKLFFDDDELFDDPRRSSSFELDQRSSSPSQHQTRDPQFQRFRKPITPDCSPIPLKSNTDSSTTSQQNCLSVTPQSSSTSNHLDQFEFDVLSRPSTRYFSYLSSSISNTSIVLAPQQMPSDYARQVLDKALAELMECSM